MKRELSPFQLASLLAVIAILFSLISSRVPNLYPGFSPLMAIAFVGAMYLPQRWGWSIGPAVLLILNMAYLATNYRVYGEILSWNLVGSLASFSIAGVLGVLIAQHKSLGKIIAGSVVCSLLFYVISNTFSWGTYLAPQYANGYSPTAAGWLQALTTGLPGYPPTWYFLRNGLVGDLFFAFVLLLLLDRSLIFGHGPAKTSSQAA